MIEVTKIINSLIIYHKSNVLKDGAKIITKTLKISKSNIAFCSRSFKMLGF